MNRKLPYVGPGNDEPDLDCLAGVPFDRANGGRTTMSRFVYLVCLVLAALRISGEKGEIFQALAHLWVGILVGIWWLASSAARSARNAKAESPGGWSSF